MVKPTQPKGLKPKSEGEANAGEKKGGAGFELTGMKLIIVNSVITLLTCLLFLGANYFIVKNVVSSSVSNVTANADGSGDGTDSADSASGDTEDKPEHGWILDLGDFILNLNDPSSRRYLKVNVALEISKLPTDPVAAGGGGNGGEGATPDPAKIIEEEMMQYKASLKDAVISTLSSKTSEELQSRAGKELAKEQIKQATNAVFNGEREVLKVSFGTFIIQ